MIETRAHNFLGELIAWTNLQNHHSGKAQGRRCPGGANHTIEWNEFRSYVSPWELERYLEEY